MSSNKSPGNTRSDNTGGGGHSSSKQGNEQQSEGKDQRQDPAAGRGDPTGQARKVGDTGSGQQSDGKS